MRSSHPKIDRKFAQVMLVCIYLCILRSLKIIDLGDVELFRAKVFFWFMVSLAVPLSLSMNLAYVCAKLLVSTPGVTVSQAYMLINHAATTSQIADFVSDFSSLLLS